MVTTALMTPDLLLLVGCVLSFALGVMCTR